MDAIAAKYRILLADDHILIRHGIKKIIEQDETFEVVGEVSNGKELMEALEQTLVDLIILDISMPGTGGLEAIEMVKAKYPDIRILMLTMHKKKQYFYNAMSAGADGYLIKDDSEEELLVALEKVVSGKRYISPFMIDDFADDVALIYSGKAKSPFQDLTKREKEILHLVVKGFTSRKMAEHLNISQRTVDHHRSNLLRKLDGKNSVDLVNFAVRHGFAGPE